MILRRFLAALVTASRDVSQAIDDIAIALRQPLKGVAYLGIAFQGAIASGTIKFSDGSHWPNAIGAANIFLAYLTIRGGEGQAIARNDPRQEGQP